MLQRNCVYLKSNKRLLLQRFMSNSLESNTDSEQNLSPTLRRIKEELAADKKTLQWRVPIGERTGDWNSKFKLFANMENTSDYLVMMQKPIDLSPKALMQWWRKREESIERHMQQYIRERIVILGTDLAAAHFLLYRGGAVRFTNSPHWMRANEKGEFDLPNKYSPDYTVEALRCDNMQLFYEGLENLRNLSKLKFLSFHNVQTFDDWCLDRISGSMLYSLEILDISGTKCTARGLSCLYRTPTLKLLIVDDPNESLEFTLSCAMLCEMLPTLNIVSADKIHANDDASAETT